MPYQLGSAIFLTHRGTPYTVSVHLPHTWSSHRKKVLTKLSNSQLATFEHLVGIESRRVSLISLSHTQVEGGNER